MVQELFEFAAEKLDMKEPEQGKCLHYQMRIRYFETITRGQTNESKTILKTHELHSIRSVGIENVVQTRKTMCCCLNGITGIGQCAFFKIAGQWVFQSVIGKTLRKPEINNAHRKINQNGTISDEQVHVNNYRMGQLRKPEKTRDKKKSEEDDEIDFPSEDISPAMYRIKKMEERKRKLSPEDGTMKSPSCKRKIKLGDDLVSSRKKKKQDIPEECEELIFNNVREKLHTKLYSTLKTLHPNMTTQIMIAIIIHLVKPVKKVFFKWE